VEEEQSIRDAFSDDSEQIEEKKEDMIDKSVEGSVQDNPTETLTQNDEDQRDCTILEEPLYSTKVEESVDTSPIYSTIQNAQTTSITDIEDREFDRQLRQQLIATANAIAEKEVSEMKGERLEREVKYLREQLTAVQQSKEEELEKCHQYYRTEALKIQKLYEEEFAKTEMLLQRLEEANSCSEHWRSLYERAIAEEEEEQCE
ncbi:hypothetical protein ADUPG1_008891, partial [Aduncisulcus paluster]